jgi:hypothetical protein
MAERGCEKVNKVQTDALKRFYEKGEDETIQW